MVPFINFHVWHRMVEPITNFQFSRWTENPAHSMMNIITYKHSNWRWLCYNVVQQLSQTILCYRDKKMTDLNSFITTILQPNVELDTIEVERGQWPTLNLHRLVIILLHFVYTGLTVGIIFLLLLAAVATPHMSSKVCNNCPKNTQRLRWNSSSFIALP